MYYNYQRYSLEFQPQENELNLYYRAGESETEKLFCKLKIAWNTLEGKVLQKSDFAPVRFETEFGIDNFSVRTFFADGPVSTPEIIQIFRFDREGLHCRFDGRAIFRLSGTLHWGEKPEKDTLAISEGRAASPVLYATSGPAAASGSNALYDRRNDLLLKLSGDGRLSLGFDWNDRNYTLDYRTGLDYGRELLFQAREEFCTKRLGLTHRFVPIKFEQPKVGWMTWYATGFDTDEKTLLENSRRFKELFGPYAGELTIWVDWEWCHCNFEGVGEEGADIFHPRKGPYPNGLAAVAEEIRRLGMTPALWIGATNEGRKNEMLEQNPGFLAGQNRMWCGQWWIDPSNPEVLDEYVSRIFRQILEWGYGVIKWDCLPASLQSWALLHDHFAEKRISPEAGLRKVAAAARKAISEETYLLSCSGQSEYDICGIMDFCDAARVGGDVFGWHEFITQGLERILHFYPCHNTALHVDADNLVLRDEFNTLAQARTRVTIYSLCGLPVTVGDRLELLDEARIDMLRRIMPPAVIRPQELVSKRMNGTMQLLCLHIARDYGSWCVGAICNLADEEADFELDFNRDFHLEAVEKYAVFDFWNQRFLGIFNGKCQLRIPSYDSLVLRMTPVSDRPEVIGSSRHITQGGVELLSVKHGEREISGIVQCAGDENTVLSIYLPEGFSAVTASGKYTVKDRIVSLEVMGTSSGVPTGFRFEFQK